MFTLSLRRPAGGIHHKHKYNEPSNRKKESRLLAVAQDLSTQDLSAQRHEVVRCVSSKSMMTKPRGWASSFCSRLGVFILPSTMRTFSK